MKELSLKQLKETLLTQNTFLGVTEEDKAKFQNFYTKVVAPLFWENHYTTQEKPSDNLQDVAYFEKYGSLHGYFFDFLFIDINNITYKLYCLTFDHCRNVVAVLKDNNERYYNLLANLHLIGIESIKNDVNGNKHYLLICQELKYCCITSYISNKNPVANILTLKMGNKAQFKKLINNELKYQGYEEKNDLEGLFNF